MPRRNRWSINAVIVLVLFAMACDRVELYSDLSEEDANEVMVLLSSNNIEATKKKEQRQNETFYTIQVVPAQMSKARELLVSHNLPRHKQLGLTGVYKEKGLIPTPDEQKARYLLALKGEIINSIERLPDVVDVDVVLNVPTRDEFAGEAARERQRPTASAIIRAKPSASSGEAITEAKVQQFVANAVEGLNPRDVAVIISYINTSDEPVLRPGDARTLAPNTLVTPKQEKQLTGEHELLGLTLDEASKNRLKVYLLLFFLLLVLLSTGLIISIVQAGRMRRRLQDLSGAAGRQPAIEGQVLAEQQQLGEGGSPLE